MFNDFFTGFEEHSCSSGLFHLKSSLTFDKTAVIDQKKSTNYLKRINISKRPDPDVASFNISFRPAVIPTTWKTSTVIPIPKTNNQKQLNDYRPVALTSFVIKMEKPVKSLIVPITESQLDPL